MEPHERLELIDNLLEDANQHVNVLNRAITAQDRARHSAQGASQSQEHDVLQQEHKWWEEACQELTAARKVLASIEQSERQRGVRT